MLSPFTPDQFYNQLNRLFVHVYQPATSPERWLALDPLRVRVRCTSALLDEQWHRPLAHLNVEDGQAEADFTIDLIDAAAAGLAMPHLPWPPQHTSPEQDTAEYREGPLWFTQHGEVMLTALNEEERRTVGVVRDAANWPLAHYKQAIFITFYQHLRRRQLYLVHASAIGRHGKALLITGSSGAGKTTTMLTCVRSGFDFLGDDTTLVCQGPGRCKLVVTLLNTLHVNESTIAWFPELVPYLSAAPNPIGKRLVMINEVYPGCVAPQAEVAAILMPQVTGKPKTTLEPVNKGEILAEMLYYSLDLNEPATARRHLEFLADLVEGVPTYRLRLGRDRERLPEVLSGLLES